MKLGEGERADLLRKPGGGGVGNCSGCWSIYSN
jgi:hypothetical protein